MNRLLVFLLAFASLIATATSKDQRTCRVVFLSKPADDTEQLFLFDGKKSYKLDVVEMNLSPVIKLNTGALNLQLAEKKPSRSKPAPEGSPQAAVAEEALDLLVIVSADPENETMPLKLDVINADPSKFKNGDMLWCNLTKNTVEGNLAEHELMLAPGDRKVVQSPAAGGADYAVKLAFRIPNDERLRPLCETTWKQDLNTRTYQLIIDQPNSMVPRITGFPDYR